MLHFDPLQINFINNSMIIIILLFYQINCLSRSRASNYQYSVWMIKNLWPIHIIFMFSFVTHHSWSFFWFFLCWYTSFLLFWYYFIICSVCICFSWIDWWIDWLHSLTVNSSQCNLVNFFSKYIMFFNSKYLLWF